MLIKITPAIAVHNSRPPTPNCWVMGSKMTTNAAVGPDTLKRDPPKSAITEPPINTVYKPCCGGTPTAIAKAMAKGIAIMPMVKPALRSPRKVLIE